MPPRLFSEQINRLAICGCRCVCTQNWAPFWRCCVRWLRERTGNRLVGHQGVPRRKEILHCRARLFPPIQGAFCFFARAFLGSSKRPSSRHMQPAGGQQGASEQPDAASRQASQQQARRCKQTAALQQHASISKQQRQQTDADSQAGSQTAPQPASLSSRQPGLWPRRLKVIGFYNLEARHIILPCTEKHGRQALYHSFVFLGTPAPHGPYAVCDAGLLLSILHQDVVSPSDLAVWESPEIMSCSLHSVTIIRGS